MVDEFSVEVHSSYPHTKGDSPYKIILISVNYLSINMDLEK